MGRHYFGFGTKPVSAMLLEDAWTLLKEKVFQTPSTPTLFNPYRDVHPVYDRRGAAQLRQRNLRNYLECYAVRPDVFLLAEAPGPWGCRFSGVPLVSESQLADPEFPVTGKATSVAAEPFSEYSARIYWKTLQPWFPCFFTWNTVPYHPHHEGRPLSIRAPTAREVSASTDVVAGLLQLMQPRLTLAIGRKAERALRLVGIEATYIRHPSQGGAKQFASGIIAALSA